jgi:hypothetical protein
MQHILILMPNNARPQGEAWLAAQSLHELEHPWARDQHIAKMLISALWLIPLVVGVLVAVLGALRLGYERIVPGPAVVPGITDSTTSVDAIMLACWRSPLSRDPPELEMLVAREWRSNQTRWSPAPDDDVATNAKQLGNSNWVNEWSQVCVDLLQRGTDATDAPHFEPAERARINTHIHLALRQLGREDILLNASHRPCLILRVSTESGKRYCLAEFDLLENHSLTPRTLTLTYPELKPISLRGRQYQDRSLWSEVIGYAVIAGIVSFFPIAPILAVLIAQALHKARTLKRRFHNAQCLHCTYSLAAWDPGLATCPECGRVQWRA